MKKSLIAFAVLSAFAASASAQSNVTVYGIIDAAVMYNTNQTATGGNKLTLDAGQLLTSRWGIKGSEDLGGGTKAIFNLEGTLANDTGAAGAGFGGNSFTQAGSGTSLFDRLSWVGLSGDFGTVTAGRNNILGVDSVGLADPMGLAHAGSNPNVMFSALNAGSLFGGFGTNQGGTALRQDNSIKYVSPFQNMNGFGVGLMYGAGEQAGNVAASRYMGASAFFTDGKNGAAVSYAKLNDSTSNATLSGLALGLKYYVTPEVKLNFTYAQTQVDGKILIPVSATLALNADQRKIVVIGAGVDYSLSQQSTITAAYYDTKRSGDVGGLLDGKADQYVLLGKYALSKRTTAYASLTYAKAGSANSQDTSLALGIIAAGNSSAVRSAVGVLHSF
ncbi:porin [Undibacterium sp. SXout20W]|uniref:porin n=1 Tax=Undibacterium sp. SXout20W TaxID=3413051 RepID=UPI003BF37573